MIPKNSSQQTEACPGKGTSTTPRDQADRAHTSLLITVAVDSRSTLQADGLAMVALMVADEVAGEAALVASPAAVGT